MMFTTSRGGVRGLAAAVLVGAALMARGAAAEDDPGKLAYMRYCSACHGPGGKGDGVVGTFMRPKPTDLTKLTKNGGGQFPSLWFMRVIDGRETIRAHGDADMPVWGEVFQAETGASLARRAEVQGKIMLITDYVRGLQQK